MRIVNSSKVNEQTMKTSSRKDGDETDTQSLVGLGNTVRAVR